MNDQPKQLPELGAETQHLMALTEELGQIKAEKGHFFWKSGQLETDNKELKQRVAGLENQLSMMTRQRDELRDEQVKWLKKK